MDFLGDSACQFVPLGYIVEASDLQVRFEHRTVTDTLPFDGFTATNHHMFVFVRRHHRL